MNEYSNQTANKEDLLRVEEVIYLEGVDWTKAISNQSNYLFLYLGCIALIAAVVYILQYY